MIILLLVVPLSSICVHPTLILSGFHGSKCYSKLCKLKSCLTHFICKTNVDSVQNISQLVHIDFWARTSHHYRCRIHSLSRRCCVRVFLSSSCHLLIRPAFEPPIRKYNTHYWKSCKLNGRSSKRSTTRNGSSVVPNIHGIPVSHFERPI